MTINQLIKNAPRIRISRGRLKIPFEWMEHLLTVTPFEAVKLMVWLRNSGWRPDIGDIERLVVPRLNLDLVEHQYGSLEAAVDNAKETNKRELEMKSQFYYWHLSCMGRMFIAYTNNDSSARMFVLNEALNQRPDLGPMIRSELKNPPEVYAGTALSFDREPHYAPCPFCNGTEITTAHEDEGFAVLCTTCGAEGPLRDTPKQAITSWDIRSQS